MSSRVTSGPQLPPSTTAAPAAAAPKSELGRLEQDVAHGLGALEDAFHSADAGVRSLLHLPAAHAVGTPVSTVPSRDPIPTTPSSPGGVTGTTPTTPVDPGGPPELKQIGHVWVIMMENQDWSAVKGNPDASYINNVLVQQGAHAENYVATTHPSEPNYIELEAGSTLGISDDGSPVKNHQSTHDHLTAYLTQKGVSWKEYAEGISGDKVPLTPEGEYQPKHNPNIYFDDNTGGGDPNNAFGIAHNRPFTEMAGDLQSGTEPQYSFITPDMIDDGHDQGGPLNNRIAQQDAFLAKTIPMIQASKDYQKDGAILVVWDEGKSGAHNPSGMIALSPFAKPGYANDVQYSHASTLRSLQEIFGVGPFLGDAKNATDLADLFQAPSTPSPAPTPAPIPDPNPEPTPAPAPTATPGA